MVKNKPVKVSQPQVSVKPEQKLSDKIIVTTDKIEYEKGDIVEITIKNNLGQSIGYWDYSGQFAPSSDVQIFLNGKWKSIDGKSICECKSNCATYANGWVELKSKATITDSWDTKEDCTGKSVDDGTYRVRFHYSLDLTSQGNFSDVYSKEFTIKTKTNMDETADWQTYSNSVMEFSMKYPLDWNVSKETILSTGTEIEFSKNQDARINIRFGVRYNQDLGRNYHLGEWVSIVRDSMIRFYDPYYTEKTTEFAGREATEFIHKDVSTPPNLYRGIYTGYTKENDWITEIIASFDSTKENIYKPFIDQILSTFKFIEKDKNIASGSKKFITEYKIDSKTGARVEIASPDIMERNKQNEVKITISDWDKFGLNLYQSFLSIMNVADYRLGDKVYSNCKESNGQEKCLVPVTPLCNWPENVTLSPLVRIKTYNPPNEPDDHVLDFPNIVVKISTPTVEICDNKIDDNCNGKIDGVDSQCASFTVYVLPGEGLTNLARRVIAQYLEKFFNNAYLSKEGKIYAEDYIKRELKNKIGPLKTGERMDFSVSLIEQAIIKAKALSFQETASLGKYKELINYGGYRFISKTSSVTDSEKVWEMDENTKKQLMEVKHFTADEGKAWKVVENTGSIIIYYENKDIDKIFYLIGAYRENMMAQDYSFMESLLTHSIEISNDGVNWEKGKVVYDNFYDKNNSSATGDGMGAGSFYLNVKDYNNGRLYVKFNLASYASGTGITLTKNLKTNLDK